MSTAEDLHDLKQSDKEQANAIGGLEVKFARVETKVDLLISSIDRTRGWVATLIVGLIIAVVGAWVTTHPLNIGAPVAATPSFAEAHPHKQPPRR